MDIFSERLKELREENNLKQTDLVDLLMSKCNIKTSAQNISYWEKGREPSYDVIVALSSLFSVSTDYLLGASNYKNYIEAGQIDTTLTREIIALLTDIKSTYKLLLNNTSIEDNNILLTTSYIDIIYMINKLIKLFFSKKSELKSLSNSLISDKTIDDLQIIKNKIKEHLDEDNEDFNKLISTIITELYSVNNYYSPLCTQTIYQVLNSINER